MQDGHGQYKSLQDRFRQQVQQLQDNQGSAQQLQEWGGNTTFAAPAATGNNSWVVGAFGISGPGCTYWAQHQQDMAAFAAEAPAAYRNIGPLGAGLEPADKQGPLMANMHAEQQHTPGSTSARKPGDTFACQPDGDTTPASFARRTRSSYKQQKGTTVQKGTAVHMGRPSSPQLDGVDYWTDKCTIFCMSHHDDSQIGAAEGWQVQGGHKGPQWLSRCSSDDSELRLAVAVSADEVMHRSSSM
jgi:hypothetical protein